MRLKLLTLAVALATISLPSHGEDLLDAYKQARANDPVLAQADAQNLATQEGVPQARALLLPQINGSYGINQVSGGSAAENVGNGALAIGHERQRTLNAQLDQVIFDWSKIAGLQAAHSTANAGDQTYQSAEQDLYVRVADVYFTILTDEDALTFAKASEDAFKKQYDQADAQYKAGIAAITGSYQAKAAFEAAKAQTITAQKTLSDARETLTKITDKPAGDLKKLRDDLPLDPPSPNDPDAWVQD